jgi:hypothetical protein
MRKFLVLTALAALCSTVPAGASFHVMQIEKVIGSVCGNPAYQAVQLRMRTGFQNLVTGRPVKAWDAAGANPVVVISPPSSVANNTTGSTILIASAELIAAAGLTADFTMTAPIPASYLAAGRLTFEDGSGGIYWSLAWGGAGYTGSNTGFTQNDSDGNFGPAFPQALPLGTGKALEFTGPATALSTSNTADYAFTSATSSAVLTNNAGTSFTLACLFADGVEVGTPTAWSSATP